MNKQKKGYVSFEADFDPNDFAEFVLQVRMCTKLNTDGFSKLTGLSPKEITEAETGEHKNYYAYIRRLMSIPKVKQHFDIGIFFGIVFS